MPAEKSEVYMSPKNWCKRALVEIEKCRHREVSERVVVLCYHSVHQTHCFRSATPGLFEQHLQWLKKHCETIRFSQVFEPREVHAHNRPAVAITFDDGNADNYEIVFPLLKKYSVPATFFLTVGLLQNDQGTIERFRLKCRDHHEDFRPLRWSQVQEMQRAGMEIGAHTYSHRNLARLDRRRAEIEIKWSKDILEQHLGRQVTLMAYPFGLPRIHFLIETEEIVAEAGYELAAAVLFRPVRPYDKRLAVPRYMIMNDETETLSDKVLGAWDFLGVWQEKVPVWVAKIVSPQNFSG